MKMPNKADKLTEDTLHKNVAVTYRGQSYTTGNRYKNLVELYKNGMFVRTVRLRTVQRGPDQDAPRDSA